MCIKHTMDTASERMTTVRCTDTRFRPQLYRARAVCTQ